MFEQPRRARTAESLAAWLREHPGIDVIGVGPDTFDEMEFYAAIFNYIATFD